ncbi:MAG: type II toxin-antitoxin system RelB/DinJ family antitoxin [Phormidesmis sp.]
MDSFNSVTNLKEKPNSAMQPESPAFTPSKAQATFDPSLKLAAEKVFESLGLTPAEAIRLFYKQVELHQGLPFEIKIPRTASGSMPPAQPSPALPAENPEELEDADDLESYDNIDQLIDSL